MVRRELIRSLCGLAVVGAITALPQVAAAQSYPERPVRVVVPYGPGGLGDVLARQIAPRMAASLKQQVIVENRPGAAGTLGAAQVAKAAADGYTLLLGYTSEIAVAPILSKSVPYDTMRDFDPVALAGVSPLLLVAHPQVPGDSLRAFAEVAQAQPEKFAYASAGAGSPAHFAGEALQRALGLRLTHVPYKGGAQAVADLVGGSVHLYFSGFPPAVPHVRSGRLKALAVTGDQRSPALPDVPTLTEIGIRDVELSGWFGFFVPRGTPPEIVQQLNSAIGSALADSELVQTLRLQGVDIAIKSPSEFGGFVRAESDKYRQLIAQFGIKTE